MNLKTRLVNLAGIEKDPVKIMLEMGNALCPKCNQHPCACNENEEEHVSAQPEQGGAEDLGASGGSEELGAPEEDSVFPLEIVKMGEEGQKNPIRDFAALVEFVRQIPEGADLNQYSLKRGQDEHQDQDQDGQTDSEGMPPAADAVGPTGHAPVTSPQGSMADYSEGVSESTTPKSSVKNKKHEIKTWDAKPASSSGSAGKSSVHNKDRTVDDGVASSIKDGSASPAASGSGLDSAGSGKSSHSPKPMTVKDGSSGGIKSIDSAKPKSGDISKTTPKPSVKPKKVEIKGEIVVPSHQGNPEDTTAKSSLHMQQHPEVKGSAPAADKSHTPSYNPKDSKVGDLDTSPASGKQPAKVPASSADIADNKVADLGSKDKEPLEQVKSKVPSEVMSKLKDAISNAKKSFDGAISKSTLDNTESIPGSPERDRFASVLGMLNKVSDLLSNKDEDSIKSAAVFVTSLPNHIRKEIPVEVNLFIGKAITPLSISDKFKEIKASRAKTKGW